MNRLIDTASTTTNPQSIFDAVCVCARGRLILAVAPGAAAGGSLLAQHTAGVVALRVHHLVALHILSHTQSNMRGQ